MALGPTYYIVKTEKVAIYRGTLSWKVFILLFPVCPMASTEAHVPWRHNEASFLNIDGEEQAMHIGAHCISHMLLGPSLHIQQPDPTLWLTRSQLTTTCKRCPLTLLSKVKLLTQHQVPRSQQGPELISEELSTSVAKIRGFMNFL